MSRSKTPWAINQFNNEYYGKKLKNTVASTDVDQTRLQERPLSQEQIDAIHQKYNIRSFSSRADFETYYLERARTAIKRELGKDNTKRSPIEKSNYIEAEAQRRVDTMYEYYKHRELLIETGQYEEIRTKEYKEQYLEHLRLGNVDADVAQNINRLTTEEFQRLITYPDTDASSPRMRMLPHIKDIYSYGLNVDTDKATTIKEEIMEAFKEAGLEFKENKRAKGQGEINKRRSFPRMYEKYENGELDVTYNRSNHSYDIEGFGNTKKNRVAKEFWEYVNAREEDEE